MPITTAWTLLQRHLQSKTEITDIIGTEPDTPYHGTVPDDRDFPALVIYQPGEITLEELSSTADLSFQEFHIEAKTIRNIEAVTLIDLVQRSMVEIEFGTTIDGYTIESIDILRSPYDDDDAKVTTRNGTTVTMKTRRIELAVGIRKDLSAVT
jgi:hypothetical protein